MQGVLVMDFGDGTVLLHEKKNKYVCLTEGMRTIDDKSLGNEDREFAQKQLEKWGSK